MTNVTSAIKFFPTAKEGFTTTTSGTVSSGAATVGLSSVTGYSNGEVVVLVIDPTDANKKQVFTGVVDTSGTQITGVVWTEGTNQDHTAGATVVDYETATHWALYRKGVLVDHSEAGAHEITANYDPSNPTLETQKWAGVASAVNEITVTNAATGNPVDISATGGDSTIDITVTPKGSTGKFILPEGKTAGLVRDRQGGTTGDNSWLTAGGSNTDTSAKAAFVQVGSLTCNTGTDVTVTFPTAFSVAPLVFVSVTSAGTQNTWARAKSITTTTFQVNAFVNSTTAATSETVAWIAVGQ